MRESVCGCVAAGEAVRAPQITMSMQSGSKVSLTALVEVAVDDDLALFWWTASRLNHS